MGKNLEKILITTSYRDKIVVRTEDADLNFPLIAARKPVELSFGSILDCGHCMIDLSKSIEFSCINKGNSIHLD
jgi:hypothetical protein